MALRRVLPDTNVCFPISLLDLLLRLDEAAIHEILWTEELLNELAAVRVARGVRSQGTAEKICDLIRTTFAGQDVPRDEYVPLIAAMPGSDLDDHPHAAAAVARAPTIILTHNVRHFPARPLARYGVVVRRPDDYLIELSDEHGDEMIRVVTHMAADHRRPPMTVAQIVDTLGRAGVPRFADILREKLQRS